MKDYELTITEFLKRAVDLFDHKGIVTKQADGSIHRYTYADAYEGSANSPTPSTTTGWRPATACR
nr:hypothetical protein [Halobellus sp. DFY28]